MRLLRGGLLLALAAALDVALALPASAAMWMRISLDPPKPRAGETITVTVLTFSLTRSLCWDDPAARPIPAAKWYSGGSEPDRLDLRLLASGPDGSEFRVPLSQRPQDGAFWDGKLVFPSSGDWTLHVLWLQDGQMVKVSGQSPEADRCAGFERTIHVMGPTDTDSPPAPNRPLVVSAWWAGVAAATALLVGGATIALLRLRRRRR